MLTQRNGLLAQLLLALALLSPASGAEGDGTFQAPFVIPNAGRPGPATVHSGDLNGDGKLDLITANGSPRILVYFQSPSSRETWRQVPLPVGSQVWFVRSADFTGDGLDDIVATDVSATAFFIKSLPGEGFQPPEPIPEARGSRWTAIGDWNQDGKLDFATANISAADVTVFLGDGAGKFTFSQRLAGSREHTLEALDYDGDGIMDLFLGTGLEGLTPHRGLGDGTFEVKKSFDHMGCVEYLAEVGHWEAGKYLLHGDVNGDGKGDLSPTCVETTTTSVGISLGDATYRQTLRIQAGPDVDSSALADLNGDGKSDLAVVSKNSTLLLVHLGKGDGEFAAEPTVFGPTGDTPVFLIVRDLDRDGFIDVISGNQVSSTLTIFWGRQGERFLESAHSLTGFGAAKSLAVGDFDGDAVPDLFLPRSDRPEVQVYVNPGSTDGLSPTTSITTQEKLTLLEVVDLDQDQTPDLLGVDPIGGNLVIVLMDATGKPRSEKSLVAGLSPAAVAVGASAAGNWFDVAVPCKGPNHVAIFRGQSPGVFADASLVPTVDKPRDAVLQDFNGDGWAELLVISDTVLGLHVARDQGSFEPHLEVARDATRLFTDLVVSDLNGDSRLDLLVTDSKSLSVLFWQGKSDRDFEAPLSFQVSGAPGGLALVDLNGDGRLDITTSNSTARSASVLLQTGDLDFRALSYGLGLTPVAHRLADFDLDGAIDLVATAASSATILSGRRGEAPKLTFRRGDVSGDGKLAITDPILILARLFQGGAPLECEVAADADDSGAVNLSDPITILRHLFQGGAPLPAPGPEACGEDATVHSLECKSGCK